MDMTKFQQAAPKRKYKFLKLILVLVAGISFATGMVVGGKVFSTQTEVVKEITVSAVPKEMQVVYRLKALGVNHLTEKQLIEIVEAAYMTKYPELILSISVHESSMKRLTKSHKGALGLTGIVPKWWDKELREEGIVGHKGDYFQVENNILACELILDKLHDMFDGKKEVVLQYYNGGYRGMDSKQCRNYAKNVIEFEKKLKV